MKPALVLALTAALLASGCGRKKEDSTVFQPVTTEPAAEPVAASPPPAQADALSAPEPSKAGLVTLCSDPNAYIRNNAKEALTSWDAQDYASAVIALQKVVSLSRDQSSYWKRFRCITRIFGSFHNSNRFLARRNSLHCGQYLVRFNI